MNSQTVGFKQSTVEQRMYVNFNGPKGKFGRHLGLDREALLERAFAIWSNQDIHRQLSSTYTVDAATRTCRRIGACTSLPADFKEHPWGTGSLASEAKVAAINAELAKIDRAEKRKKQELEFLSEDAAREKEEAEAVERSAILAGTSDQVEQRTFQDEAGVSKTFIHALGADGLMLQEVLPDIELAGDIDVGDGIAMTGFGGNVWWSGSVTGVALDRRGNLRTSVAFSGDCSTWDGVLKAKDYGKAKITIGRGGKPDTVKHGWVVLGGAKPVRVRGSID